MAPISKKKDFQLKITLEMISKTTWHQISVFRLNTSFCGVDFAFGIMAIKSDKF